MQIKIETNYATQETLVRVAISDEELMELSPAELRGLRESTFKNSTMLMALAALAIKAETKDMVPHDFERKEKDITPQKPALPPSHE